MCLRAFRHSSAEFNDIDHSMPQHCTTCVMHIESPHIVMVELIIYLTSMIPAAPTSYKHC